MMDDDLPSNYDVIVVGTGMVESILAAAFSRIGKKVLHLDRNMYYGQLWATTGLDTLQDLLKGPAEQPKDGFVDPSDGLRYVPTESETSKVRECYQKWYIPEVIQEKGPGSTEGEANREDPGKESEEICHMDEPAEEVEKEKPKSWCVEEISKQYRKFNLDLMPKIIYNQGAMVQLLVSSKVSRYLEFINVSNILAYFDSTIHIVPCSKSEVFSNKELTMIDKRILMKQLETILNYSEDSSLHQEWKGKTFHEYLVSQKLSSKLIHYILHAIAMVTEDVPFEKAVSNVCEFLSNIGHYGGTSPFLWPLYGSGELLQAFCRMSAVYGGIYYLNRGAQALAVDPKTNVCKGIISNGSLLSAEFVVLSSCNFPSFVSSSDKKLVRAIIISDSTLCLGGKKDTVSVLNFPYSKTHQLQLIEVPGNAGACPRGLYVVHVTCTDGTLDSTSLLNLVSPLFADTTGRPDDREKPKILYYSFFKICNYAPENYSIEIPSNVQICSGLSPGIDFEEVVDEAKQIFCRLFPEEIFLEPMPDPQEESNASTPYEEKENVIEVEVNAETGDSIPSSPSGEPTPT